MKLKRFSLVSLFSQSALILSISFLSFMIFWSWQKGIFNFDNLSLVADSQRVIKSLSSDVNFGDIQKLLTLDKAKQTIDRVNLMVNKLRSSNVFFDEKAEYENRLLDLEQAKKDLSVVASMPTLKGVVRVLLRKVTGFEQFVIFNQWRTLTRLSGQMKLNLDSALQSPVIINRDLAKLSKRVHQLTTSMRKITLRSRLVDEDKQSVVNLLDKMETEIKLIGEYSKAYLVVQQKVALYQKEFSSWIQTLGPIFQNKKEVMERNLHFFFISLFVFGGSLIFAWGLILFAGRIDDKKLEKSVEREVISLMNNQLVKFSSDELSGSVTFAGQFHKIRNYVHKRMSLGAVFQESLPFASVLLDSNLQMIWANKLFQELWKIDNPADFTSISWDFLQQKTNLGESDPIPETLKSKIAGIYQVQIQEEEKQTSLPYEMYVSPIEYQGQDRIMIFFYPMKSVEDTMHNLTRSLVGPIKRTLNSLINGEYSEEFRGKIEKDFEIAGIEDLYDDFNQYDNQVCMQNDAYEDEINFLSEELSRARELIENSIDVRNREAQMKQELATSFEATKSKVIEGVGIRDQIVSEISEVFEEVDQLSVAEHALLTSTELLQSQLNDNIKAINSLDQLRGKFKVAQKELDTFRQDYTLLMDKTWVDMKKRIGVSAELDELTQPVKSEFSKLEGMIKNYSKLIKNVDVSISKALMLLDKYEAISIDAVKDTFHQSRKVISHKKQATAGLQNQGEGNNEEIVESLKEILTLFKHNRKLLGEQKEKLTKERNLWPSKEEKENVSSELILANQTIENTQKKQQYLC